MLSITLSWDDIPRTASELHSFKLQNERIHLDHWSILTYPKRDLTQPRPVGGSCPLAYALKGLENLQLDEKAEVALFLNITHAIMENIGVFDKKIDYIVPMPSSSKLTMLIAEMLKCQLHKPILPLLKKRHWRFSMKNVPLAERHLQQPLKLKANAVTYYPLLRNATVLLVDDLVATGSTMLNAIELLSTSFSNVSTLGFSLFKTEC